MDFFPRLPLKRIHLLAQLQLQCLPINTMASRYEILSPTESLLIRQKSKRVAGDDLAFLALLFVISVTTRSLVSFALTRRSEQMSCELISFVFLLS